MKVEGMHWGARAETHGEGGAAGIRLLRFEDTGPSPFDEGGVPFGAGPVGVFGHESREWMIEHLSALAESHDKRLAIDDPERWPDVLAHEKYVEIATTIVNALYPEP
ncbi:MAG: hypothetical protein WAL35_03150 [Acidimicrobiales bacterium]